MKRIACGARNLISPFPFPLPGQAGAGGFPPRRKHAARQPKALARCDAAGSPHKRGGRPLVSPPLAHAARYGNGTQGMHFVLESGQTTTY